MMLMSLGFDLAVRMIGNMKNPKRGFGQHLKRVRKSRSYEAKKMVKEIIEAITFHGMGSKLEVGDISDALKSVLYKHENIKLEEIK